MVELLNLELSYQLSSKRFHMHLQKKRDTSLENMHELMYEHRRLFYTLWYVSLSNIIFCESYKQQNCY